MEDLNLKYRASHSKIVIYIYMIISVCLAIALIINISSLYISILLAVTLVAFIILTVRRIRFYRRCGSFEEIDIYDNKIYYRNETYGLIVLEPKDILRIRIRDYNHNGNKRYNILIFLDNLNEITFCHGDLSYYDEFIEKIINYKKDNDIKG